MFVIRTKEQGVDPEWGGYCYLLDPESRKPKRFVTNSEALAYLLDNCENEKVLNTLEIINEDTDGVTRIAKSEDGLTFH